MGGADIAAPMTAFFTLRSTAKRAAHTAGGGKIPNHLSGRSNLSGARCTERAGDSEGPLPPGTVLKQVGQSAHRWLSQQLGERTNSSQQTQRRTMVRSWHSRGRDTEDAWRLSVPSTRLCGGTGYGNLGSEWVPVIVVRPPDTAVGIVRWGWPMIPGLFAVMQVSPNRVAGSR